MQGPEAQLGEECAYPPSVSQQNTSNELSKKVYEIFYLAISKTNAHQVMQENQEPVY